MGRHDTGLVAKTQAEKLDRVVRLAMRPLGLKYKTADHLNKKVRRLLEDALDAFWSSSAAECRSRRALARLIVCALTGERAWDYQRLAYNDPRIVAVDVALREHNKYLTAASAPVAADDDYGGPVPLGFRPQATKPYVSEKDLLKANGTPLPGATADGGEATVVEIELPDEDTTPPAQKTPARPDPADEIEFYC